MGRSRGNVFDEEKQKKLGQKKQYQDKVESMPIGQIIDEIKEGFDDMKKTADLATTYKVGRQLAVLREVINDYVAFALEMELDLDDPFF